MKQSLSAFLFLLVAPTLGQLCALPGRCSCNVEKGLCIDGPLRNRACACAKKPTFLPDRDRFQCCSVIDFPEVTTTEGKIRGRTVKGANRFFGIPYAKPPVGELRYAPPSWPAEQWDGVLDLGEHEFGKFCTALKLRPGKTLLSGYESFGKEDCLYLDVQVPDDVKRGEKLPVIMWMHGGGFSFGNSAGAIQLGKTLKYGDYYDASALAKDQRLMVVNINYRLNSQGFLAHPALRDEYGASGMFGIQDQRAALQWIKRNARAFGGDPDRVTIYGESAGAISVCTHLASPASAGLFHRAISQSGTCDGTVMFFPRDEAEAFGRKYAASMGCDDTTDELRDNPAAVRACLRDIEPIKITESLIGWLNDDWPFARGSGLGGQVPLPPLAPFFSFNPVIDFDNKVGELDDFPVRVMERGPGGGGNFVPSILGSTAGEGTLFVMVVPFLDRIRHRDNAGNISFIPTLTPEQTQYTMEFFFNSSISAEIIDFYRKGAGGALEGARAPWYNSRDLLNENMLLLSEVLRDYFFVCSTRRMARAMAPHTNVHIYEFKYDLSYPNSKIYSGPVRGVVPWAFGNFHASDIALVFGQGPRVDWTFLANKWTKKDKEMSQIMQSHWATMARTGRPFVDWPQLDEKSQPVMNLELPTSIKDVSDDAICEFFDRPGSRLGGGLEGEWLY